MDNFIAATTRRFEQDRLGRGAAEGTGLTPSRLLPSPCGWQEGSRSQNPAGADRDPREGSAGPAPKAKPRPPAAARCRPPRRRGGLSPGPPPRPGASERDSAGRGSALPLRPSPPEPRRPGPDRVGPGRAGQQRHGAGDGEGGHPHLHGRRQLPAGRPRAVRGGEVRGGRAGPGPPRAQRPPAAGLRGRDRRARADPLLRQGLDLQPRSLRAQQVRALQAPEPAARRAAGPGGRDRVRGTQLPARLGCGAVCENLSHGLAFSANHMEEPDGCFH